MEDINVATTEEGGLKTRMSKSYNITREEVAASWKMVRQAGGCAGYDGQTIETVEANEDNTLYKIWNRLASGSYQAAPVLLVDIPKAKGGVRTLGIPTVTDRIAQGVIKARLEKDVQPHFHPNSYAYQAGKSAIDAVGRAREVCMKGMHKWLLDMDIKAYFDEIDHELMLEMLSRYTEDKAVLMYCRKFLKANGRREAGEEIQREKGTQQGGVVSPVLANLFLHEAFDKWMIEEFPTLPFERYADDIILHCVSEKQAQYVRSRVEARFQQYKLRLSEEKTKIVYTGTDNDQDHRGHGCPRKFTFLGYDFKPRGYKGKLIYTPGIGKGALKKIREEIRKYDLTAKVGNSIEQVAKDLNPKIRGWTNYYGHYRRSGLYAMAYYIDNRIVGWLKRKRKSVKTYCQGWKMLKAIKEEQPQLFCHWYMIRSPIRAV